MANYLKKIIQKYWLPIFIVIIVISSYIFGVSFDDFIKSIYSLKIWQIIILILTYFIISALTIISRKYLLLLMSSNASFKKLTIIHFSSMAAHYTTPVKLGFPITIFLLNKLENIEYSKGIAIVLIEFAISMIITGVIAFIGSIYVFKQRVALFLFIFLLFVTLFFIVYLILDKICKNKKKRLNLFFSDFINNFAQIPSSKAVLYIFMMIIIISLGAINLMFLCYFFSVNLSFWEALASTNSAFFLGAITMIPMGLGTREATMLFYLDFFGIPPDISIAVITLQRLISTGLTFLIGALSATLLGLKNLMKNSQTG